MLDSKFHASGNFICVKVINVSDEHIWICISARSFDGRLGIVQTCAVFVKQGEPPTPFYGK
ncbi:hypothetical protein FOMA001_g4387 [Fusarium oxysporum f. sp. matthiolae]|nr:hypothetical protein FOMA001_g4387 [Fusarium oxysporum f. sp. matthiolae]